MKGIDTVSVTDVLFVTVSRNGVSLMKGIDTCIFNLIVN